jgi:hypothetical protein
MRRLPLFLVLLTTALAAPVSAAWPPPLGADMSKPENWPSDGGFAQKATDPDGKTWITGGDWNLWSFVPEGKPGSGEWDQFPGFRQVEKKIGAGMHADRGWQLTTGDRRVIVAVLDSGIKWDADDLVNKHYLNRKEVPEPDKACRGPNWSDKDPWDSDGDGIFNMMDWAKEDGNGLPTTPCDPKVSDLNKNGFLDPQDLIKVFSDGKDGDGNGYVDDISGWDFFRNDNDAYDDTRYGHGTGEASDSTAEGNNGRGSLGICPECTHLPCRVADSFLADANDFAAAVIFATDSGASVVQEALGSINRGHYADAAIEYAYVNNVAIIASAADELSFHHNMPGTTDHTIYVHAIVFDGASAKVSTTFLNFNNCTNYGGNLLLSSPGTGCSSEATGVTSGHAGMLYSAALKAGLNPPLSAEEVRGTLIMTADDVDVPESKTDPSKFPSGPGWDLHFGYGRNNVYESAKAILDGRIPPEADIFQPSWFANLEIGRNPKVKIIGRVGSRADGKPARHKDYSWVLEYAKGIDPKSGWTEIKKGTGEIKDKGEIAEWDAAKAAEAIDFTAPLVDHDQYSFTLRLRVEAKTAKGETVKNEFRKSVGLFKEPDLLPGFPIHYKASIEASPKMFDLDGDGKDEYIQPTTDGLIHAFKADGTEAKGWPVSTPVRKEFTEGPWNLSKACAYRTDKAGCKAQNGGALKPEYRELMIATPAIGDLDKDGKVEVVMTTYDGHVLVFGADGQPRKGFPASIERTKAHKESDPEHLYDDGIFAAPSLGDLDKDGKLEIVVAAMDQRVYVFRADGTQQKGFPVTVRDPILGDKHGDRIITTPSIGDVNGDGLLDIATGTNEALGAEKAKNEARGYVIHGDGNDHAGGPYLKGFPVTTYGLMSYVLPTVGSGVPGNPALIDLDFDGKLEVNFDTIGAAGSFYTWEGKNFTWTAPGGKKKSETLDNQTFGPKSNSTDKPAYILIANASLGRIDPTGGVDFVKPTAGFNFALTFASGGKRAEFDHHLSAWDLQTGKMLEGWPRVIDDWQFFSNPAIVDLDADNKPEVVAGSAGYLVHAWNYLGQEPKGFPKYTMGWVLASPAVGDVDGDGKFDVGVGTRDGWIFAWKTQAGKTEKATVEWPFMSHDVHNTGNYHSPINPYAKTQTGKPQPDATAGSDTTVADTTATKPTPKTEDDGCTAARTSTGNGTLAVAIGLSVIGIGVAIARRARQRREAPLKGERGA